ncbi:MAG: DUF4064 domain-containing protein [Methanobrevibacter sp.]|jgi:hypothetical protein|nr:DUF4064 domain-containing protein [Candidatus Methanovirga aequatorialis]
MNEKKINNINNVVKVEPTSRTTELILGILGGVFGLIGAVFGMMIGSLDASFNGESQIIGLSLGAFIFSILGLIFSILIKKNHKLYGILTLLSGIALLICISLFGSIGAIFFVIAGILGVVRK